MHALNEHNVTTYVQKSQRLVSCVLYLQLVLLLSAIEMNKSINQWHLEDAPTVIRGGGLLVTLIHS